MKSSLFAVINPLKLIVFSIVFAFFSASPVFSEEHPAESESEEHSSEEEFNAGEMIMHHISDSHEWHVATIGHKHYTFPLPMIVYSPQTGLDVFSSHKFRAEGFEHEGEHNESSVYNGYKLDHAGNLISVDPRRTFYDFSITKNAASIILGGAIILIVFLSVARSFKKNAGRGPRGIQSFMEPLIIFIRDEIAIPNIGEKKAPKYLPYLLTIFFFIWINNLLGLLPTGANASGNIAFTISLAVITALIVNFSGNKDYWKHIFWTPGVPLPLRLIMIPVELIGVITKPFALMIRLFANITAGHIVILSLFSFIFIFKSIFVGIPAGAFAIAMTFLELLVAALQAYIFTMLAALFIGTAVEEHHHEEAHH